VAAGAGGGRLGSMSNPFASLGGSGSSEEEPETPEPVRTLQQRQAASRTLVRQPAS